MKCWIKPLALTLCTGLLISTSFAADPTEEMKKKLEDAKKQYEQMKKDATKELQPADKKAPEGMKPEDAAMMEAMMKLSQPGEQHKIIHAFAGTWKADMKFWMDPTQTEPQTSTGIMTAKLLHGDRFLVGEYTSKFMGMDFSGTLTWGYNTIKNCYQSTWFDNMGTYMLIAEGKPSADGKTIDSTAQFAMPGPDGKMMDITQKEKIVWVDNNTFKQVMWHATKDHGEQKVMEITYTRQAAAKPSPAAPGLTAPGVTAPGLTMPPAADKVEQQRRNGVPMPTAPAPK